MHVIYMDGCKREKAARDVKRKWQLTAEKRKRNRLESNGTFESNGIGRSIGRNEIQCIRWPISRGKQKEGKGIEREESRGARGNGTCSLSLSLSCVTRKSQSLVLPDLSTGSMTLAC